LGLLFISEFESFLKSDCAHAENFRKKTGHVAVFLLREMMKSHDDFHHRMMKKQVTLRCFSLAMMKIIGKVPIRG
jgi:hypothetical protein